MLNTTISEAALWYWEVRRREAVLIDADLRERALEVVAALHKLFASNQTPRANYDKRLCDACSLLEICGVKSLGEDHSKLFINKLFTI